MRVLLMAALLVGLGAMARYGSPPPPPAPAAPIDRGRESTLFSPEDLNILEGPDRGEWQQPERIMDALRIADGSRVADIGAGGGWFTIRLANRVGPNGRVYAEDIQPLMLAAIERRVAREGLGNVTTVLGSADDPKLPAGLDAVLVVDTYPQLDDPVGLLRNVRASLAPGGLVGIVEFTKAGAGGPGPPLAERVAPDVVVRDGAAAGLTLISVETFLRYQYMVIFANQPR
jgi:SAM-dependent methyltransferase